MDLNLDSVTPLEPFRITLNGKQHEFDLLELIFNMKHLAPQIEQALGAPEKLASVLGALFNLQLTPVQAFVVFRTLSETSEQQLDALLKNVSGRSPSLITTSELPFPTIETSPIANVPA